MKIHELNFSIDTPLRLSRDDPAATTWEADTHAPEVIMQVVGDWCWIEVDGVASYRFPREATGLEVRAEAFLLPPASGGPVAIAAAVTDGAVSSDPVTADLIIDLYYRVVVPLALQVYGLESMHGTALQYDGGAVLLSAPSRTGKSTLAAALADSGATVIADDGLVWEAPSGVDSAADAGDAYLRPIPFSLMLRKSGARRVQPTSSEARHLTGTARPVSVERVAIRLVVLLDRGDATDVTSQRLSRREAFTRLLGSSYALTISDKGRKGRMMAAYLRFAAAVPVYSMSYPTGLDRLPEVVAQVERLLFEVQSGSSRP